MRTILFLIILLPLVSAVQIESVYFNPLNEAGSEYVLLKNNGNNSVNITGWTIKTPTSEKDATLEGIIQAGSTFLITDSGWEEKKDNETWPEANYEETITLANTNGFVQLVSDKVESTVGYGETDVYEGNPHPGAEEGFALVRIGETGDNEEDFVSARPTFEMKTETTGTEIIVEVDNVKPEIVNIKIEDDLEKEGIQILPLPGGVREVKVEILVEDNNTLEGIVVEANGIELELNEGKFSGKIPITTESEEVGLKIIDGEHILKETIEIDLLPVAGIKTEEKVRLNLKPGQNKKINLIIKNTGSVNTSLQIKGITPNLNGNIVETIKYKLFGQIFSLEESFRQHKVQIAPEDETAIELDITAGKIPAGEYSGQILIASLAI